MNSALFCKSFVFKILRFSTYKYTDNSEGVRTNYLAYMAEGHARIRTDTETVEIGEGDVFFIPDGCKYRSYWYGEPRIEFISLGFGCMPDFEGRSYPPQVLLRDDATVAVMRSLAEKKVLDGADVGRFYTLLGALLPRMVYREKTGKSALVDKATRLIAADPHRSVGDLARACAVSESALYAAFKKCGGKSILAVKNEAIMERAAELLVSTDDSVEEISRRLSFSSGAYFRKCFKAHFGLSPRALRKKHEI
ncbi:MAG: helix-turn-helix domain-containing protein [Clostridia bacterium]|nr:helix-turn-helix domain-containing protein [Clostridia bacterium]